MNAHYIFNTYLNTKYYLAQMVGKYDIPKDTGIYIPMKEIGNRFFPYPTFNAKKELLNLQEQGYIKIKETPTKKGHYNTYKPLKNGDIDFSLLDIYAQNVTPLHRQIMKHLKRTSLPDGLESTTYFELFQKNKNNYLPLFFIVDSFARRIHTPISNLKKEIREQILLDGCETSAIDVVTMQPLVLGQILKQLIGKNEFSQWISSGIDIYNMLQERAHLQNRDEAKKLFYKIIFGWPSDKVVKMFGASNWVNTINEIKKKPIPQNPKYVSKPHSNLAWLLQNMEVKTMTKVWAKLLEERIPFLTVHDEIICKESDLAQAEEIFHDVLSNEYEFYDIKTTRKNDPLKSKIELRDIENLKLFFDGFDYSRSPKYFSDGCKLVNPKEFADTYLAKVQDNYSKKFNPYLHRLIDFIDLANV